MKRIAILLSLLIPLSAYAQSTEKPSMVTPPPNPAANTANIATGVVTDLTAEIITVKTDAPNPMSFAMSKSIQYADKKGRKVKKQRIGPGAHVKVYFQGNEDTRTATRIVVDG